MIRSIIFDFNQVLYGSTAFENLNLQLMSWCSTNQKKFKFYIWSSSNPATLQLIKEQFQPLFYDVISTQETGLYKSEVSSYKQIEKLISATAAGCLLIDDQIENITAAQKAGWQTIHFTSTADCLRQLDTILG